MEYENHKYLTFKKMVEDDCKLTGNKLPKDYYYSL
jgi:hypothetical protein